MECDKKIIKLDYSSFGGKIISLWDVQELAMRNLKRFFFPVCGPVSTYRLMWSGETPVQDKLWDGEEMTLERWVGAQAGKCLDSAVLWSCDLNLSNRELHKFLSREAPWSGIYFTKIIMTSCGGVFGNGGQREKRSMFIKLFKFYTDASGIRKVGMDLKHTGKGKLIKLGVWMDMGRWEKEAGESWK